MKEFNTLTRAEMQIMNILWDKGCGMTTHPSHIPLTPLSPRL